MTLIYFYRKIVQYLLTCRRAIYKSFVKVLCPIFNWCVRVCVLLSYKNSLYILDLRLISEIFAYIFPFWEFYIHPFNNSLWNTKWFFVLYLNLVYSFFSCSCFWYHLSISILCKIKSLKNILYAWAHMCPQYAFGGQRIACRSWFCSSNASWGLNTVGQA